MDVKLPSKKELAHFVRESNAIEREYAKPGELLYDNHLTAAQAVVFAAPHGYLSVREIHSLLLKGVEVFRGQYRTQPVVIADGKGGVLQYLPNPFWVEQMLMPEYEHMVYNARLRAIPGIMSEDDREILARALHDHGLCIHPFDDGNGRTFRLFWNQLRLAFGLPWVTVKKVDVAAYYEQIQCYEKHFSQEYAHTYPKDQL